MRNSNKQEIIWTHCPRCQDREDHKVVGEFYICTVCKTKRKNEYNLSSSNYTR
jgi:hypothetical protein